MTLLEKLIDIRKRKALTWTLIAKEMGLSRPALERFRKGGIIAELTLLKVAKWVDNQK